MHFYKEISVVLTHERNWYLQHIVMAESNSRYQPNSDTDAKIGAAIRRIARQSAKKIAVISVVKDAAFRYAGSEFKCW